MFYISQIDLHPNKNLPEYDGRKEWKKLSIEDFWEYESCYVWLDEFEKWFEGFVYWNSLSIKEQNTELCFIPALPKEHALYFRETELPKLTPKATLDKEKQDEWKKEELPPWLIPDPKDPQPKQKWYIPARYFARQLAKDDSTLLTKRDQLAIKVVRSLTTAGFMKRGGKLPFDPVTIKKALSNVSLG